MDMAKLKSAFLQVEMFEFSTQETLVTASVCNRRMEALREQKATQRRQRAPRRSALREVTITSDGSGHVETQEEDVVSSRGRV